MMRSSESPDLLDDRPMSRDDEDRPGVRRLRAATLDDAVARVDAEFGPGAEIIEANRIRRGGVGGFFATDLGVEVVVQVDGRPRPDERPHFYDRVVEEDDDRIVPRPRREQPADVESAVERLIAAAEQGDRGRRGNESRTTDNSFAAHFERELARPEPVPAPTVRPTSAPVDAIATPGPRPAVEPERSVVDERDEPDETIIAADAPSQRRGRPGTVQLSRARRDRRTSATSPADERTKGSTAPTPADVDDVSGPTRPTGPTGPTAEEASTEHVDPGVDDDVETTPETTVATDAARDRSDHEVVTADEIVSDDRGRDLARRQIDLASGAIGRVVEQLSDVVALDGSRVADLSRLTISVTGPDGTRIEVAAELFGGSEGR